MVAEVLAALRPRPDGRYVDGTIAGGGHAAAILQASTPSGWLFGCDRDGAALEAAAARLAAFDRRFELKRGNFSELADWLEPETWAEALAICSAPSAKSRAASLMLL